MLLCLVFCAEIMLALEDLYGDLWFYHSRNQHMVVFWVMLSPGVSRCAGDIGKTHVNAMHVCTRDIGKRDIFEAVASGGAGDLLFTMTVVQTQCEVVMCLTVGFATDLGNTACDDLRTRFCFDMSGP